MNQRLTKSVRSAVVLVGRYAKTDTLYLAKNGSWSFLSFALTSALSLGVAIIAANVLTKDTYGAYRYVLSLVGLASAFSLTGMNSAVVRAVARGDDGVLFYAVRKQLVWNLSSVLMMSLAAAYFSFRGNVTLGISMVILGITIPPSWSFNTYAAFLVGKKDFKTSTHYSLLITAVSSAAMVAAMVWLGNVVGLVAVYGFSNLLLTFYFYRKTVSQHHLKKASKEACEDVSAFGGHLTALNAVSIVTQQLDAIVVFHYGGSALLAVYSFANIVPERIKKFAKSISATIIPKISVKGAEALSRSLYLRYFQAACLGLCGSLAYIVAAPLLFKAFFPNYIGALRYSQIISLNLVFTLPITYGVYVAQGQKMIKSLYVTSFSINIFRFIAIGVGGRFWGVTGVICAKLLSNGFSAAGGAYFLRRELLRCAKADSQVACDPV